MRLLILTILSFSAYGASAKQVEVLCTPKAYSCYNSPEGYICRWNNIASNTAPALVRAYHDPSKAGENYDVYRAQYRTSIDRHSLTLRMDFKVYFDQSSEPDSINATLDAGSVIAEASGRDFIDISLRNNNYGRGYTCHSFRVLD